MEKEDKIKEVVRLKLTEYLKANNCRKTPERYAILDIIYSERGHFDIESLYNRMKNQNFKVSKATIYNAMQLFVECNLVAKHQFGNNLSVYERVYNKELHNHLICTVCNNIREYKDTELKSIIQNRKINHFTPSHYNLYIYGVCGACGRKQKLKEQKKQ
ncbi:MAG: transcriptional repressor [Dysgonamonadaceae bacterium]|jgi:Fur family ferric uptake transcriptional regulator|nr:transcriptional repressor [Dysgonamonadaceae bacterium]